MKKHESADCIWSIRLSTSCSVEFVCRSYSRPCAKAVETRSWMMVSTTSSDEEEKWAACSAVSSPGANEGAAAGAAAGAMEALRAGGIAEERRSVMKMLAPKVIATIWHDLVAEQLLQPAERRRPRSYNC